ncbi:MAG: hypothetical protein H0X24_18765 [Ktedonobacterales bacterium]|nr:hypothetical protein [Ktedonobacterales bacterium]
MTTRMLPEPVIRMSQFYRARADGTQFRGSCGQTALAVAMAAARGTPTDYEGVGELMIVLTRAMVANGTAAPNGASRLSALAQAARDAGCPVALELPYQAPQMAGWRAILREHAGQQPIVLQVAQGEALADAETGGRDDVGLRYHAIAVLGLSEAGYICADSDNSEVTRRFQIYPEATLAAAQPCGLLMLALTRAKNSGTKC